MPTAANGSPADAPAPAAPLVVVMGVSGSGKSTVGEALARALALPYLDGDDLHPPRNVERMAAGIALTDEDRAGWLDAIGERLAAAAAAGTGLVVACSARRRRYRDRLRQFAPALRLVHLHGPAPVIEQRLARRSGHYMPASLLGSQFAALEPPGADEPALVLDVTQPADTLVDAALAEWSGLDSASASVCAPPAATAPGSATAR